MRKYWKLISLVVVMMFLGTFAHAEPQLIIFGAEAGNATLYMYADNGDDSADKWTLVSVASDNTLQFQNNGTVRFTVGATGNFDIGGDIVLENDEVIVNDADGTVGIECDTNEDMILDVQSKKTTHGDASITLTGDAGADNGDVWKLFHDAGNNTFNLQNDTSGSQATKFALTTAGLLSITGTTNNSATVTAGESSYADMVLDADEGDDNADTFTLRSTVANTLDVLNHTTVIASMSSAGNLQIDGDLYVDGGQSYMGTSSDDQGYWDILSNTQLVFICTYTGGVAVTPTVTNVIDGDIVN